MPIRTLLIAKRLFCIAIIALLTLAGDRAPSGAALEPVEIPVILSLTGNGSFIGQGELIGLKGVEAETNKTGGIDGRPLKFAVFDDQSTPQVAVQLFNAAMAKKPSVILGSSIAATCNAIVALAKGGPVLYCLSNVIQTQPGSSTFAVFMTLSDQLAATMRYFRQRGVKRVGLIVSSDASGQDAETAVKDLLALPDNASMKLVVQEHFSLGDLTVAAQMARIKAADPQLLVAFTVGVGAGTLLKGVSESGLDVPVVTSSGNLVYAQLKHLENVLPKKLYFGGAPVNVPDQVRDAATKKALATFRDEVTALSARPELLQAAGWDSGMIVVSALRKVGPDASAERLRSYLGTVADYTGVMGPYDFPKFPQRGLGSSNVIVVRWDPTKSGLLVGVSKPGGDPL
jgi:branched-chain amino acid transport system substrate-binding protein